MNFKKQFNLMFVLFLKKIMGLFCPNCYSFLSMKKGYYHRAWNNLCNQGAGDDGALCNNCLKITWDKSPEEFIKTKKPWISDPYDLKKNKIKYDK